MGPSALPSLPENQEKKKKERENKRKKKEGEVHSRTFLLFGNSHRLSPLVPWQVECEGDARIICLLFLEKQPFRYSTAHTNRTYISLKVILL